MRVKKMNDKSYKLDAASRVATVTCGQCGARVHEPANVCDPVRIPDDGSLGE